MRLQQISPANNSGMRNKRNVSFKWILTDDIGASAKKQGTLKTLVQDNEGRDLFKLNGFVNDDPKGFQSEDDFCKKVAQKADVEGFLNKSIASITKELKANKSSEEETKKLQEKLDELQKNKQIMQNLPPEEKKLSDISLLLPGTTEGQEAIFMKNLLKQNDDYLHNVNLQNVVSEIIKQGKVKLSDTFDIKKNLTVNKDLKGAGAAIAEKIVEDERLSKFIEDLIATKNEAKIVVAMTGGGFGCVDIDIEKENGNTVFRIVTNESGHDKYPNYETVKPQRLGEMGTSASTVVKRYAKELGIVNKKDLKILGDTGIAKLATQKQVKFNNSLGEEPVNILLNTGVYEVVNKNSESTTLRVKKSQVKQFNRASKNAIKTYARALALNSITAIDKFTNLYVITGPLAMGLNSRIKERVAEKPGAFGEGVKDMRTLVLKYIDKLAVNDGKIDTTIVDLRNSNHFDVICDESIDIPDNTRGGALMLHGEHRGSSKVVIPLDTIKKFSKKFIKTV